MPARPRSTTATTRSEHLAWCKQRALAYLPHDPVQAFASMMSDLRKHEATADHIGIDIGAMMLYLGHVDRESEVRRWIEGFG